jgi:hypothetical protein
MPTAMLAGEHLSFSVLGFLVITAAHMTIRDIVVAIAAQYGLYEFESQWWKKFSLLHVVQTG